jgi:hypothetical protein
VIISEHPARLPRFAAAAAVIVGAAAWALHYHHGLVLSHYDAKAHLVVARRVFDNLTPGWQQVGAVWLPLPHLLNLLPVQIDFFYRTGFSATAISIASFAVCAWASARLVLATTGSMTGALAAAAVLILNPNLLYLQATPMTEPLLIGLSALVVLYLVEWVARQAPGSGLQASGASGEWPEAAGARSPKPEAVDVPWRLGLASAALAWTRYEGWPVIAAAFALTMLALLRKGLPFAVVVRRMGRLAAWPALAVMLFLVNSRITVGAWFVSGGFYAPDPTYAGKVGRTLVSLWWGTHQLSGYAIEIVALASAAVLIVRAIGRSSEAHLAIPIALFAAAALPFYAFFEGHPYRIRYMIPLVAACAPLAGIGIGMMKRAAPLAAVLVIASVVIESPPWSQTTPLLLEAQWDRPNSIARRRVTACLAREYRGEKILASMGSLAHYMQELSNERFDIRDFVNEGNGVLWDLALDTGPAPHAGWMLVEEVAEGGDVLAQKVREAPAFAARMERVCEGGGVALYRRTSGDVRRKHRFEPKAKG